MDLGMNEKEFTKVLNMFGKARGEFDRIGKHERARDCENAIALAQEIAVVLSGDRSPAI